MRWILLALFLSPQQQELDRWVQQLGDDRFEMRQEASERLRAIGRPAREALRRASHSGDAEVRWRARELLRSIEAEIAREERERLLRPKRLRLVTLDARDAPLREILGQLEEQTRIRFESEGVDPERRVDVKVKEAPLGEVLALLGLTYDAFPRHGRLVPLVPNTIFTEGMRFSFAVRKSAAGGCILETDVFRELDGDADWEIAAIRAGGELSFETCEVHSPRRVRVAADDLTGARVTVRGFRRWYSDTPQILEFTPPQQGRRQRSPGFEVALRAASIEVRSERPLPESAIKRAFMPVSLTWQPGRDVLHRKQVGTPGSSPDRIPAQSRGEPAWCGCPAAPQPRRPTERIQKCALVDLEPFEGFEGISSITVAFNRPFEERFELTSSTLK